MKRLLITLCLVAAGSLSAAAQDQHQHQHGQEHGKSKEQHHAPASPAQTAPVKLAPGEIIKRGAAVGDSPSVKYTEVVKDPQQFADRQVILEGTVQRVCQKQGCWMEIMPDKAERGIRIEFNDHAFFIPFNSTGLRARAEGKFSVKQLSKEEAEHYESAGATLKLDKNGEARQLIFVATGVELKKI